MMMRRTKARLRTMLLTIAAVLCLLPGSAMASILNNGYPYGRNMTSSRITLVIESDNPGATYQWQMADSKDGTYSPIIDNDNLSGSNTNTLQFRRMNSSNSTIESYSGKWYRCVVDGTPSRAVKIVYPGKDGRTWTKAYSSWYITNETVAYMANGKYFDVAGLYKKDTTEYMLSTSYNRKWDLYSRTEPNPSGTKYSINENNDRYAELDALRVSFNVGDPYSVTFEADLQSNEQAFCFGCDTQIGNDITSGGYYDNAALSATMDGNSLKQIAMVGAGSIQNASVNAPAFVIRPVDPCSKFWIGKYSDRLNYAYNTTTDYGERTTIDNVNVVTLVENKDSGMTMSWLNVPEGGTVRFQFSVGSVANTGAVGCTANYFDENLEGLDANTNYQITIINGSSSGNVYWIQADSNGKIKLAGTDMNGQSYNFIGQSLKISKENSQDKPKNMVIADRPAAVLPTKDQITVGTDNVSFEYVAGQEYEYSTNNGTDWQTLTVTDGNCVISGLQPDSNVIIRTRKPATANSFASAWTETSVSITKSPIHPSVTMADWVFGGEPSKPVVTGNPGNGAVTIEYKLRDDDVTAYRPEVPTQPGEYTVRVLIAETANYQGGQASAHFSILLGTDTLPRTGDGSRPALWLGLLALAGAGLAALLLRRRKS